MKILVKEMDEIFLNEYFPVLNTVKLGRSNSIINRIMILLERDNVVSLKAKSFVVKVWRLGRSIMLK